MVKHLVIVPALEILSLDIWVSKGSRDTAGRDIAYTHGSILFPPLFLVGQLFLSWYGLFRSYLIKAIPSYWPDNDISY